MILVSNIVRQAICLGCWCLSFCLSLRGNALKMIVCFVFVLQTKQNDLNKKRKTLTKLNRLSKITRKIKPEVTLITLGSLKEVSTKKQHEQLEKLLEKTKKNKKNWKTTRTPPPKKKKKNLDFFKEELFKKIQVASFRFPPPCSQPPSWPVWSPDSK